MLVVNVECETVRPAFEHVMEARGKVRKDVRVNLTRHDQVPLLIVRHTVQYYTVVLLKCRLSAQRSALFLFSFFEIR